MFNRDVVDYVKKVLTMGFSNDQIEKAMENKGYKKNDIENLIKEVMDKKTINNIFHKKVETIVHDNLIKKTDKHVITFIKKELKRGYHNNQIENTLIEDGYAKENISKLVETLAKRHKNAEHFEHIIEKISSLPLFHVPNKWLKKFIIGLMALGFFSSFFYFTNKTISEFVMKALAFTVAVPITAYFIHKFSLRSKELIYSDSLRLIGIFAAIIFFIETFSNSWMTLIAIVFALYVFAYLLKHNYKYTTKNAVAVTFSVFIISAVSVYLVLFMLGIISGIFGVLR